ncbi:MAG: ribbon-helix-helix domain-containing protein [Geminicoccaceae bacterium]
MCDIYAGTDPALYEPVTRSLRLHGAVTSIRLERQFWAILDTIAAEESLTTPRFVTQLHDEVLERRGEVENFASLLRVICTAYSARSTAGDPVQMAS